MSITEERGKIIKVAKCPDCKKRNLLVYKRGYIHCGNCGMGGNIRADKYKHLKPK